MQQDSGKGVLEYEDFVKALKLGIDLTVFHGSVNWQVHLMRRQQEMSCCVLRQYYDIAHYYSNMRPCVRPDCSASAPDAQQLLHRPGTRKFGKCRQRKRFGVLYVYHWD